VKCGECCKAGYKVFINRDDFIDWDENKKSKLLEHVKIDPKCISMKDLNEHQKKNGNAIKKIKNNNLNQDYELKLRELILFIQENHLYQGKEYYPLDYFTIIPYMRDNPILVPKSFNIIFEALTRGIDYIIKLDSNGACPFLNLNLCSIQNYKPSACKAFPFNKDGHMRDDDYFFSICRGLQ
jgi:Fe-S-cluster containining protein